MKRLNIIYFVSISLGATAFQVYSEGMNNLPWAYAGFMFSIMSWLSMMFLYHPTIKVVEKLTKLKEEILVKDKSFFELNKNEFFSILLLGVLSFGNFALLLPFLKNQETAIYYTIIGSALVRIIAIEVAQKIFNDRIGNKFLFWVGFIICIIGVFLFKYNDFKNGGINYVVITCSLIWGCIGVVQDQIKRYVTSPFSKRKRKIPYFSGVLLSVKTLGESSEFIKTFLFLFTTIIFLLINQTPLSIPSHKDFFSSVWIGYFVTVFGVAIALMLKNKIEEAASSILQSMRVISSMAYAPFITLIMVNEFSMEMWSDVWKWIGVAVISAGSFIGFVYGKPAKAELNAIP